MNDKRISYAFNVGMEKFSLSRHSGQKSVATATRNPLVHSENMDCRVKPGNDVRMSSFSGGALAETRESIVTLSKIPVPGIDGSSDVMPGLDPGTGNDERR
jgi:hypothetical protein